MGRRSNDRGYGDNLWTRRRCGGPWPLRGRKGGFEPVGFWVDKDWKVIRKDLEKRLDYEKLEVLFSDGGPGIEDNLLSEGMRLQRCAWHGKRDFPFLLTRMERKKKNSNLFTRL